MTADDLWETHADWWQDGFTDGADPEYEEQILPLAAERPGRGRAACSTSGCGEGQVARLAAAIGGASVVVGIDPTWNQIAVAAERGGGPAYARAGADALPFADGCVRRRRRLPRVRAHRRRRRGDRRGRPRAARPAAASVLPQPPAAADADSGWIDDQILDPPEQYWRIGPYLVEDETIEEVEKDVFIPFIHRPLSRYVNALAANGLLDRADGRAGAAARLPRPGRGVRRRGDHPAPAATSARARSRPADRRRPSVR